MDLMIYSDDALDIIKLGEMDQQQTMDYFKKHSKNDVAQVKAIIGAYAAELIVAADEEDIKLDLSYDTIKNIPAALQALYQKQHKLGLKDQRNKELTCRSFAAYIDLLIINNFEDVSIDVRRYPNNKENEARPDRWTGFLTLILDGKKNSDMLPFIWKGANPDAGDAKGAAAGGGKPAAGTVTASTPSDITADSATTGVAATTVGATTGNATDGFTIDIGPLTDGCKKLTGSKLQDEGLTSITLTYEEEGPHLITPKGNEKEPHLILPEDAKKGSLLITPHDKDEEPHLIL